MAHVTGKTGGHKRSVGCQSDGYGVEWNFVRTARRGGRLKSLLGRGGRLSFGKPVKLIVMEDNVNIRVASGGVHKVLKTFIERPAVSDED